MSIKELNYAEYLEWATQQENNLHARQNGLNNISCEDNHFAILTNEQVEYICKLLEDGYQYTDILIKLGLEVTDNNKDLIGNIKRGIAWSEISQKYNLKDINYKYRNTIFSENTVHCICKAIANGLTIREIIENILGIKYINTEVNKREYECIRRIKNKQQYTDISCEYF